MTSAHFKPGTVWCYAGYYVFLVLEDDTMLCLDDGDVPTGDVGRTFAVLELSSFNSLKKCEQIA